jgi:predicted nucleic acid-binding protein
MAYSIALLDANVLYPAPIRDILLQLAFEDFFQAKWTQQIQDEWVDALLRHEPQRDRQALERTRHLMNKAIPDANIENYEQLVTCLDLPDKDDRHVLAAAIVGRCDVIVTQNLKDFPNKTVNLYEIDIQHPDDFLSGFLNQSPGQFCSAVRKVRARLKNPPYSVMDYLATLTRQGLVATVSRLEQFSDLL